MTCQHSNVYGTRCLDCGGAVPDPFFLTPAERLSLTARSTSPNGPEPLGKLTEWWDAIDSDDEWIENQMRALK